MAIEQKTPEQGAERTSRGRIFRGTVVSTKMKDTVVVSVERYVKHPKYKKYIRRSQRFLAHDPGNTVAEGDQVSIKEAKPISKRKRFEIVTNNLSS